MKLPGTYAAYAVLMAVFGQTPRGIHLGLLLVNLATTALLFLLARRMLGEATAAAAAGMFAVVSSSPAVLGMFAHATHFVLLPAIAGFLVLQKAIDRQPVSSAGIAALLAVAGGLLGLAFLMKQHGMFFVLGGCAWILGAPGAGGGRFSGRAARCGLLLLGAALPLGFTCLALARAGVFRAFWFWTFDYARAYVTQVPLLPGLWNLAGMFSEVAASAWPFWILAAAGLTAPFWDDETRYSGRILAILALVSFLAICPGLYFREHYFVLLLPAAALLAAVAAAAAGRAAGGLAGTGAAGGDRNAALVSLMLVAVAAVSTLYAEREIRFTLSPARVSRTLYGPNPFPEARVIAARIASDTRPDDRVAVLGSEPEIYFYAHRRSATGHIYMYGLMEEQPYARVMQQEAIREIEASKPAYVVFVNVPQSWLARPGSDPAILTWSRSYLTEHYRLEGLAEIRDAEETVYVWGEEALSYTPRSPYGVYVFRREAS